MRVTGSVFMYKHDSRHVETVVVLRDKKVDGHISIDLDVEKIGLNHKL